MNKTAKLPLEESAYDRPIHWVADLYSPATEDELAGLAADIKANGLKVPIVVDKDGAVVDGRHRLKACQMVGVKPAFVTTDEKDLLKLSISLNRQRLNRKPSQIAIAAAEAWDQVEVDQGRPKSARTGLTLGQTRDVLAKMFGVGKNNVQMARALVLEDRQAADTIKSGGQLTIAEAYRELQARKEKSQSAEVVLAKLREAAPDLADIVDEGRMSVAEANGALDKRRQHEVTIQQAATANLASVFRHLFPGPMKPAQKALDAFGKVNAKYWTHDDALTADNMRACIRVLEAAVKIIQEVENGTEASTD